jgi:hypothetical protein
VACIAKEDKVVSFFKSLKLLIIKIFLAA